MAVRLSNREAGAECTRGPPGLGREWPRWRRGRLLRGVRSYRSGGSQPGYRVLRAMSTLAPEPQGPRADSARTAPDGLLGGIGRRGIGRRVGLRDHGETAGLQRALGAGLSPPLAVPSLLRMRLVERPAVAVAAIEDHRNGLARELLLQVLVELRVVARDDEQVPQGHQLLRGALEPEAHVELAQHRARRREMLLGPGGVAGEPIEPAQAKVVPRDERAHRQLLGEDERLGIVGRRLVVGAILAGGAARGDVAEQAQRPRLVP